MVDNFKADRLIKLLTCLLEQLHVVSVSLIISVSSFQFVGTQSDLFKMFWFSRKERYAKLCPLIGQKKNL